MRANRSAAGCFRRKDAEETAKDEVWGDYRFAVVADGQETDGLKVIDLGAGHSSRGGTLCGRVIAALKSEALLNESVGAGYIERNWPPALMESAAWPLASLRQSFLNGSLTRLVDPDAILRGKIVELRKDSAKALKTGAPPEPVPGPSPQPGPGPIAAPEPSPAPEPEPASGVTTKTLRLVGTIPPEVWNRLGTKILPKLRAGSDLRIGLEFTVTVKADTAGSLEAELQQIL
jgi:hypothetical protein